MLNTHLHSVIKNEPAIAFVDQLINDAIAQRASDIHIEPYEHQCRIRYRCDGLLHETVTIPVHLATQVIMRLKVMAHLDTTEKRLPLDGRIQLGNSFKNDIRINTCPTLFGEKIVLRLLGTHHINLDIHALGMIDAQKEIFLKKLSRPQGLILVRGPTGSGKTLTLYSALHHLNEIEKNITTIEDPVEIELRGINQININPRIGLDFSTILRALLRQDPDIIMIGEIRDVETATIALQAAQTGHLVLTTLHTNSATEALSRLTSMGIASYQFTDSVSLIIAQRLVRTLCPYCKKLTNQPNTLGCEQCQNGYAGRTGIFEFLSMPELPTNHIKLWDIGLEKVNDGTTSYAEITRVLGK